MIFGSFLEFLYLDQVREHDLEPPKFARTAFSKLLSDWRSVKSLLMYGTRETQKLALQFCKILIF